MESKFSYTFKNNKELEDAIMEYYEICFQHYNKNMTSETQKAEEHIKKKYGDPEKWNTENITSMSHLFSGVDEQIDFSIFDISNWNTSNVTNMKELFLDKYIWYDLSKWDVSKVENMNCMFKNAEFDIKLNLSNWNIKNIKNKKDMFKGSNYKDYVIF